MDFTVIFLHNDQPDTCGYCGARTELLACWKHTNLQAEIQCCLNPVCGAEFLMGADAEFNAYFGFE